MELHTQLCEARRPSFKSFPALGYVLPALRRVSIADGGVRRIGLWREFYDVAGALASLKACPEFSMTHGIAKETRWE